MKNQAPQKPITNQQFNPEPAQEDSDDSIYFNMLNPSSRIQCNYCKRDITQFTKIYVQQPDKQQGYLCVSCFTNEIETIKCYHVINKLDFPLYEPHWSAYEELLFFEGLQKHGYSNCSDISDFLVSLGKKKSPDENQEHYKLVYLKNSNFLPDTTILVRRNEENMLVYFDPQNKLKRAIKPFKPKQTETSSKATQKVSTNPADIVGYMRQREDFEIQYDHDAELLLAQMEFNYDDTEEEKAMKFRLIDIYNHKLKQRYKRKDFAISHKILDIREQMRLDKTRTKDQKEIFNLMKVFARFNNPEEHDKIVQGFIKEKQLRQRIAQLKELKAKGLKTLGEVEDQMDNKKKKDDKSKRGQSDLFNLEKGKTRRVRKDPMVEKSEKRVLYINNHEEQLCKRLNMTFKQYMAMKQTILRESVRQGLISKNEITGLLHVKRQISEAVFDFVVEQQNLMETQNPPEESLQ